MLQLGIKSVTDDSFAAYGRVWHDAGPRFMSVTEALERRCPLPDGTDYVASEPELENAEGADALKRFLFGGSRAQLGWCNGHNTRLNCLEYHRSSEFNLGSRDFILLLARLQDLDGGALDSSDVVAYRVPAGILVEIYSTTLHYAPCQVDERGFKVMIALPEGTNAPRAEDGASTEICGDAALLWATDKWLIAHSASDEAAAGAYVGITGPNIDIANCLDTRH